MRRILRASMALALAVSCLAAPLLADQCTTSCEMNHASGLSSAPTCHRSTAPAARIGRHPERCGHDHNAPATIGAADLIRLTRSSIWTDAAVVPSTPAPDTMQQHLVYSASSPPAESPSRAALISPLRI